MLSTSQEGRGCPAGHRGREAQGERHDGRARVRPSSRPEAVEGVAVVCCCSSVDLVAVGSRVGGCCGCLNGGEVVGTDQEQRKNKGREGKERKEEKNSEEKE